MSGAVCLTCGTDLATPTSKCQCGNERMIIDIVSAPVDPDDLGSMTPLDLNSVTSGMQKVISFLTTLDEDAESALDTSGLTGRGLGVARAVYPLLEDLHERSGSLLKRLRRPIEVYLERTKSTSAVIGGRSYDFKGSTGTYVYDKEKLHDALEPLVGTALTAEEFAQACPSVFVEAVVIPAHEEINVDGNAIARILKKRGGQPATKIGDEVLTLEQLVDKFRTRPVSAPSLKRAK